MKMANIYLDGIRTARFQTIVYLAAFNTTFRMHSSFSVEKQERRKDDRQTKINTQTLPNKSTPLKNPPRLKDSKQGFYSLTFQQQCRSCFYFLYSNDHCIDNTCDCDIIGLRFWYHYIPHSPRWYLNKNVITNKEPETSIYYTDTYNILWCGFSFTPSLKVKNLLDKFWHQNPWSCINLIHYKTT